MCGLAGVLETTGRTPDPELLARFNRLLAHRGPDGEGAVVDGPVGLVHRRLSILDLTEAARQPMWDEAGRACLVYNGEIYNFRELRKELEAAGWSFQSQGDTEVLLKACLHYGVPEAVARLDGMFALALWEPAERRLWLARDRMGIKPLYYAVHDGRVLFGSEIKPLLEGRPAEPDRITLLDVLAGGTPHWGPHTLYEGVVSVEPGEWLCFDASGRMTGGRFFRLLDQLHPELYREAERTPAPALRKSLHGLLEQSVRMHLVSDAPLAVLASGGLDSSLIAALAASAQPGVDLYHADVVGPGSERAAAEQVAAHLGLRLHVAPLTGEQYVRDLATVAYYNEGPSSYHPNDIPFHLVSRLASGHGIKVLLTGEGADELFHGYGEMQRRIARRALAGLAGRLRPLVGRLPGGAQMLKLLSSSRETQSSLTRRGEEQALREEAREACGFIADPAEREILVDSVLFCSAHLQSLLHRNDRMGMMEGLESRIPYLQNDLIRFAINLPPRFKVRGHLLAPGFRNAMRSNKWLLRQVGSSLLPPALHTRRKLGFPVTPLNYLKPGAEFFDGGFLQETLRIAPRAWSPLWSAAPRKFQWSSFSAEVWGRIYFQRETPDAVAGRVLRFAASGAGGASA